MPEGVLSPQQILDAAEQVLIRFGPHKATVSDAARLLGVSHGSIYRHFPNRTALREAVVTRWLARLRSPLETNKDSVPVWLDTVCQLHLDAALASPHLHAAYAELPTTSQVMATHLQALAALLADRMHAHPVPEWASDRSHAAATALAALSAFLDPRLTASPQGLPALRDLVTAGLTLRPETPTGPA